MKYPCFDYIEVSDDWAFENVRSTEQWTHGYHRYPAKFLPNVVKKLIENYANKDGIIADLFAGCGTTLVEAKVHGIASVGTDINPIATLITRVKTTPIAPDVLRLAYEQIFEKMNLFDMAKSNGDKVHDRIDYWFRPEEKAKIAYLYQLVSEVEDVPVKEFFLVAISHILKNCSWWLQSSTKPQKDPNKNIPCPFESFRQHCKHMMKGNRQYYQELCEKGFLDTPCTIYKADARETPIDSESIDIIITSPPYVTSYEYADIHQLTGYWMDYFSDLSSFRKSFIGTSYSDNRSTNTADSRLGEKVVEALLEKDKRIAYDVAQYFSDMQLVAQEMYRILKYGGYACVVIGNTTLRGVHIKSAEVFYDLLQKTGLKEVWVIKRNIPCKLMPTLRDKVTGKFTTLDNEDCKKVYPDEFIIVVRK